MKNYVSRFIMNHPRQAPWIDALIGSSLYALLAWLLLDGTLLSHTAEIIAVGVGGFVGTVIARRRLQRQLNRKDD